MSEIWDKLIDCEQKIIAKCASLGTENFDDPEFDWLNNCLLYTSPSPRDMRRSRMPSSA